MAVKNKKMKVKVKIIKCSKSTLWYRDYVGKTFIGEIINKTFFPDLQMDIFKKHIGIGLHIKDGDFLL